MPEKVAQQMIDAEKNQSKMHHACRGHWKSSTLVLSVKKRGKATSQEVWNYFTAEDLAKHLKSEELAADPIQRHKEQEKKLPAAQKGMFMRKSLE